MTATMTNESTLSATYAAPTEPSILSANTYFWSGASNASSRRSNEERHQAKVASYFEAIGFEVSRSGDNVYGVFADVKVCFSYSESCKNVYKSLSVTRSGKNSNIKTVRKIAAMTPDERRAYAVTVKIKASL